MYKINSFVNQSTRISPRNNQLRTMIREDTNESDNSYNNRELEKKKINYDNYINDLENQINLLKDENQRLKYLVSEKERIINTLIKSQESVNYNNQEINTLLFDKNKRMDNQKGRKEIENNNNQTKVNFDRNLAIQYEKEISKLIELLKEENKNKEKFEILYNKVIVDNANLIDNINQEIDSLCNWIENYSDDSLYNLNKDTKNILNENFAVKDRDNILFKKINLNKLRNSIIISINQNKNKENDTNKGNLPIYKKYA